MILSKTKQVCPELSRKGFTLIELLTVIAIIIILAGAVIVNVTYARERGRDAKRTSDLQSIQTAVESFNNTFGKYPGVLGNQPGKYLSASQTSYTADQFTQWGNTVNLYCDLVADSTLPICSGVTTKGNKLLTILPLDPINRLASPGNLLGNSPSDQAYLYYTDPNGTYFILGTNLESTDNASNSNNFGNYRITGGNVPAILPTI